MFCVVIHKTYYKNSDLSRAFSQCIMVCEVDMITQYLQKILGNHVEFKVCLVSKPVVHVVFSNFLKSERYLLMQTVLKMYDKTNIDICFGMIS